MDTLLNFIFFTFGAFVVILNPMGIIPQYVAFTVDLNPLEKKAIIKSASFISGTLLLITSIVESMVFQAFGITAPTFKVAGGVILFLFVAIASQFVIDGIKASEFWE